MSALAETDIWILTNDVKKKKKKKHVFLFVCFLQKKNPVKKNKKNKKNYTPIPWFNKLLNRL